MTPRFPGEAYLRPFLAFLGGLPMDLSDLTPAERRGVRRVQRRHRSIRRRAWWKQLFRDLFGTKAR